MNTSAHAIKVLIVDDSAIVRQILSDAIAAEPDMIVVGTAPDPYVARDKILALKPDVLTLDLDMPRMDGLTFLKHLMRYSPVPTIVVSTLGQASCSATLEALRLGAVDVVAKPGGPYTVRDLRLCLVQKIRAASIARLRIADIPERRPNAVAHPDFAPDPATVIAIGASTGGIVAIQDILLGLSADMPAMVVTQHIPAGFSQAFARRLNALCALEVREAEPGDRPRPGLVLIAPGDRHLLLRQTSQGYAVELQDGPRVSHQKPSVDVMFASVARAAGANGIGLLLTGMGTDGARGLLAMRQAGALTIAQDEASSAVYGMPREAVRLDAAALVVPLEGMPDLLAGATKKVCNQESYLIGGRA